MLSLGLLVLLAHGIWEGHSGCHWSLLVTRVLGMTSHDLSVGIRKSLASRWPVATRIWRAVPNIPRDKGSCRILGILMDEEAGELRYGVR